MMDAKERSELIVEYSDLVLRIRNLNALLDEYGGGVTNAPSRQEFPYNLRLKQMKAMSKYRDILEIRLELLGCNVDEIVRIVEQDASNKTRMVQIMNGKGRGLGMGC